MNCGQAAKIGGAGFWLIFRRIILPLSAPILVVSVIPAPSPRWDDFCFGVCFSSGRSPADHRGA